MSILVIALGFVLVGCPAPEVSDDSDTVLVTAGLAKDCSEDADCAGVFVGDVCGCSCVVDVIAASAV